MYWFNEPFIGSEVFRKIAKRSQDSLGDRHTPELHVELPIVKSFDGLCLNPSWWALLTEKKSDLKNASLDVVSLLKTDNETESTLLDLEILNKQLNTSIDEFGKGIKYRDFHERIPNIVSSLEKLSSLYEKFYKYARDKTDWFERKNHSRAKLSKLFSEIKNLIFFVKQEDLVFSQKKSALLYGEAGIGKSHLLCNLSLHRIEGKLPTLFLLGSQYTEGNPINFIKESLDLQNHENCHVLEAINAAGEASGTRALIVIDAINEGKHRDDWRDQIMGFLSDLSQFQYIAVLFSCRSTYLNYILPESTDENKLPRIEHSGFRGYEHRAAEKFLSRQGISKPSAPMLTPEFTNPLFLKTCCQALRQNRQHSFPKGLNSLTSLFDFYIESVERTIATKKRFNVQESIIKSTMKDIASKLLPNNLEGIPKKEARNLVNTYDPNPTIGDSLFDILLDEGIISEDVSYGKKEESGNLVIRFTYERFSDHFIAQKLVDNIEDIEIAFSDKGVINTLLREKGYYSTAGIFESLAIIISERFNRELEDLLPDDIEIKRWQLNETFQNMVLLRSPKSFSEKTLELLNNLDANNSKLDIFLKLSTEPNHPWNAELLHRNLMDKKIADRDHFWSIHIAHGDRSEENDKYESITRSIIEWAHSGEIESVEEERIRLCAITLLWFLTTPNRRIRNLSTKSLVRILSSYPKLVKDLLCEFSKVDDTYLTGRLFAVAYGVICNIDNGTIITEIADTTYNLIFKDEKPIPHLLLRDYAHGILERASHLGLISPSIIPELFRPPYKSNSELENPSIKEIQKIAGDDFSSLIKSPLMGFPGDFGNYTMACVHRWSFTPISLSKTENSIELKKRFGNELLTGDVQKEYLGKIEPLKTDNSSASPEKYERSYGDQRKKEEDFNARVNAQLNNEQQEYYRWLSGISNNKPAAFSKKWAQRWVCKRAYGFGWSEERFADFETECFHRRGSDPMERMGKKYQWMAFHEFLAKLSDKYHWINEGYSVFPDDDVYEGPWQIAERDIDPTIWARQSGKYETHYKKQRTWWQPYSFPFPNENDPAIKANFLWDKSILPDFSELLQRKKPSDDTNWSVLHGFCYETEDGKYSNDDSESPYLDGWSQKNSLEIRLSLKVLFLLPNMNGGSTAKIVPSTARFPSTCRQRS